jgi:peptidoglycan/LPS O-acetylase OafA/YrhL
MLGWNLTEIRMTEKRPPSRGRPKGEAKGAVPNLNPPFPKYRFRHFSQLDGFRGLAVLFVIIGHLLTYGGPGQALTAVGLALASTGVFLFFVLSGFLITGLLQLERSEKGYVDLKRFYIRRALRLAPALLAFLALIFILKLAGLVKDVAAYEIAACLLYARNFFGKSLTLAHIWSLSLEEQFYFCWPSIFRILPARQAFAITTMITLSIAAWRSLAIEFAWFDYRRGVFYMRPYFRFDSILIGACIALGFATNVKCLEVASQLARKIPVVVLWIFLAAWTYCGEAFSKSLFLTIQMILIALILCDLILGGSQLSQAFFNNRLLRYMGRISYALYLWQQIFLVVKLPSWGLLRQFPVNLVASVLMAIGSYHFIETPALRLKNQFE